ncbi:MAG: alpha/beta fold hydrolase [Bdellovibrionota bacterium]
MLLTAIYTGCRTVFLHPSKDFHPLPKIVKESFTQFEVIDENQPTLIAWKFIPNKPKGVVIFLHGNAGNLSSQYGIPFWLYQQGYSVYTFDYRGFGGSEGTESVSGAYEDSKRFINNVLPEVEAEKLFLYGQSFGATIALRLVCEDQVAKHFKLLIADSPFASYSKIVRDKLKENWLTVPLFPLSYLFSDKLSPDECIAETSLEKILLLHADNDRTIPVEHSKELKQLLGNKAELLISETASHNTVIGDPLIILRINEHLP